jgi:Ca2+-dependent lipid-binding protein
MNSFVHGSYHSRFNHSEDPDSQLVDAYVNVDCDEYHIGKTVTRPKTKCPVWNEDYQVTIKTSNLDSNKPKIALGN